MENISIIIGRQRISLGDSMDVVDKYKNIPYSTFESNGDNKLVIIELPLTAYSRIEFRGKKYKTINELIEDNKLYTNEHLFCCGEGEDMQLVKVEDIDIATCPFGSKDIMDCSDICHNIHVYRGQHTTGFDMAQIVYNHGLECIMIAKPGYAFITD